MITLTRLGVVVLSAIMVLSVGPIGCGGDSDDGSLLFQARGGKGKGKSTPPPPEPEPTPVPAPEPSPVPPSAGWTVLAPSADSLMVYVSDSDGNDADNGLTEATAKRTVSAGIAMLRTGYPDWLQLKAGDTFTNQSLGNWTRSGRSASEPMVVTSYGSGARPRLLTGGGDGLCGFANAKAHLAFVGLHFTPHTYSGSAGCTGINWLSATQDVLVEDCRIEGYKDNISVQAFDGPNVNFRIRRCVIADSWSTSGFSQGLYVYGLENLLVEECVFDHNGWKEGAGGSSPTVYNHNAYFQECPNLTVRGNLFMRASNLGTKFRSDYTGGMTGMLIENNVYIEGAVGISCGGNTPYAGRFSNVTVRQNLLMHIGRTNPVGQGIAWYMSVSDWNTGSIEDNLMLYQAQFSDGFGIRFEGSSDQDVQVSGNLFYKLRSRGLILPVNGSMTGITVTGNEFQDTSNGSQPVHHSGSFGSVTYQSNVYASNAAVGAWFSVNGISRSYTQWVTDSGETGSSAGTVSYPDPNRDEATYMTSLGLESSMAAFAQHARAQSKSSWYPEFTAGALNTYIREGYGR